MSAPRTSIIMPVYNTADTVVRAIDSVLAQTDPDFELLIMIDGSPDSSAQVITEYLEHNPDERIRVFNNPKNQGVSAVRNQGLDNAHGAWIAFIDSDDTYRPEFLEKLHTAVNTRDADVAVCGHALVDPHKGRTIRVRFPIGTFTGKDSALKLLEDRMTPYLWDKIFQAHTVNGIRFPQDIHRAEDAYFVVAAFARAQRVVTTDEALYDYTVDAGGLTWGRITPVDESVRLVAYLRDAVNNIAPTPRKRKAISTSHTLTFLNNAQQALIVGGPDAEDVIKKCRSEFSWLQIFDTAQTRVIYGAAGALLKISPALYRVLYGAYVKRTYGL
ncbi:MAG: glycosyltransferase family 2 protein [Rothia sp. (in: high G+C Gram-positive bacteria)]|uniref:glycosyltransferase family 2 protein n=1 Tax=Rothia sp. (in: high G+C Gram-positive bacteria) TaxID=1885016 RepID=UPI0026DBDA7B|nr:glycosyltransferase family 2 protein [Rothia sp. (in: high G+C Gram-positive bacteria)]MDO4883364.1 glycosyltransferase family 2 protein [Rothia sp. (in: high G+C Gram-positive bacteria)]